MSGVRSAGIVPSRWPAWTFRSQRAYAANLGLHDIVWDFDERELADFNLFEWRDGVLACPVRRHDYRLFRGDV